MKKKLIDLLRQYHVEWDIRRIVARPDIPVDDLRQTGRWLRDGLHYSFGLYRRDAEAPTIPQSPCCYAYNELRGYFTVGRGWTHAPTIADILDSLLQEVVEGGTFADWCSMIGDSTDSRTAIRIFEQLQEQSRALRVMFNAEELATLREAAQ